MTQFAFGVTAPTPTVLSAALGTSGQVWDSQTEIGKAVSLVAGGSAAQNFALSAASAEIDGFVWAVEPITVNGGFSFGSVQRTGFVKAVVGANQGGTAMAVGDYVVADTQLAVGTGNTNEWGTLSSGSTSTTYGAAPGTIPSLPTVPLGQVKTGTPTHKFWQVMSILSGTGAAGSTVLLYRD